MNKTWLILDTSNLAYRAFHTTGDLQFGGDATGVLFGIFRDIQQLQNDFATNNIVFCFDGGYDYRLSIYPDYKISRRSKKREMTEEELQSRKGLRKQIYRLRTKYLEEAGFKNILWQDGFEADDLIAACCQTLPKGDKAIIVSSDEDLYQLLSPFVIIYSPTRKKARTEDWFKEKYKIGPAQWPDVKALAGCKTDDIPGVDGVGEVTASKFLAGTLKPETKKYQSIIGNKCWERNLKLTRLPAVGTEKIELHPDNVTTKQWNAVMKSLGMKSLMGKVG